MEIGYNLNLNDLSHTISSSFKKIASLPLQQKIIGVVSLIFLSFLMTYFFVINRSKIKAQFNPPDLQKVDDIQNIANKKGINKNNEGEGEFQENKLKKNLETPKTKEIPPSSEKANAAHDNINGVQAKSEITLKELVDIVVDNLDIQFPIMRGNCKVGQYSEKDVAGHGTNALLPYYHTHNNKEYFHQSIQNSINEIEEFVKERKISLGDVSIRMIIQDHNEDLFHLQAFNKKQSDGTFFRKASFRNRKDANPEDNQSPAAKGCIEATSAKEWTKKACEGMQYNMSRLDWVLKHRIPLHLYS